MTPIGLYDPPDQPSALVIRCDCDTLFPFPVNQNEEQCPTCDTRVHFSDAAAAFLRKASI